MLYQLARITERNLTSLTREWFLAGVDPPMNLVRGRVCKRLAAQVAEHIVTTQTLAVVDAAQVFRQVAVETERLIAEVTGEWSITGVGPAMLC